MIIRKIFRTIRGAVFPECCFGCGRACPLAHNLPLCPGCLPRLALNRGPVCPDCGREKTTHPGGARCGAGPRDADEVFFLMRYEGLSKKILYRFKINRDIRFRRLIRHLADGFFSQKDMRLDYEAVVPIPPHRRAWFRPSPSKEMAAIVSNLRGLPMRDVLRRRSAMRKQSTLSKHERLRNVRGAFGVTGGARLAGRLLLVDDVLTTGYTAAECARVLKQNGALKVGILACARGALS